MNLWRECMEIRITTCGISFLTKALNPCNPGEVNCAMPENEANVEYSQLQEFREMYRDVEYNGS